MNRLNPLLALGLLITLGGCTNSSDSAEPAAQADSRPTSQPASRPAAKGPTLAARVAERHGGPAWSGVEAIRARLRVAFGERPPLEGVLLYAPHQNRVRLDLEGGTTLVFDGERAWCAPKAFPRARFHLLTWPYFLAAPYKLGDPGSELKEAGPHALRPGGAKHTLARLSFGAGVGDTPDDWYDVYVGEDATLLALGYIVTYGKSAEEAAKAPHAALYEDYETIGGLRLSTRWVFHDWTRAQGVHGEPLGEATLRELTLVTPEAGAFDPPEGAVEDALPK